MKNHLQPVLHDLTLNVHQGEMVALMGESGSGKSTLMNILGLLDRPTAGNYFFDGKNVAYLSEDEGALLRNQSIGFVFQQFYLLSKLTAKQNVELPLLYLGMAKKERLKRVDELLELVGMEDRATHRPMELSGGQQQRVALARALACRPKLILADEPTGALDSKTADDVMHLFKTLHQAQKTTLLIVTHSTKVGDVCQRKITMEDGRFISDIKQESEK